MHVHGAWHVHVHDTWHETVIFDEAGLPPGGGCEPMVLLLSTTSCDGWEGMCMCMVRCMFHVKCGICYVEGEGIQLARCEAERRRKASWTRRRAVAG